MVRVVKQVDGPCDYCYCGAPVSMLTSWTHNPRRKFIACKYYDRETETRRCKYFWWLDLDRITWQRDVINQILLEKRLMKIEMNAMNKEIEELGYPKRRFMNEAGKHNRNGGAYHTVLLMGCLMFVVIVVALVVLFK